MANKAIHSNDPGMAEYATQGYIPQQSKYHPNPVTNGDPLKVTGVDAIQKIDPKARNAWYSSSIKDVDPAESPVFSRKKNNNNLLSKIAKDHADELNKSDLVQQEVLSDAEKKDIHYTIDNLIDSIDINKRNLADNIDVIFRVFMLLNNFGSKLDRRYAQDTLEKMNEVAKEICSKQKSNAWIGQLIAGTLQIVGGGIGCVGGVAAPVLSLSGDLVNALQMVSQGTGSAGQGTGTIAEIFANKDRADAALEEHFKQMMASKREDRSSSNREERDKIEAARKNLEQMLNALHDTIMRMLNA